jgi:hypothetical protein
VVLLPQAAVSRETQAALVASKCRTEPSENARLQAAVPTPLEPSWSEDQLCPWTKDSLPAGRAAMKWLSVQTVHHRGKIRTREFAFNRYYNDFVECIESRTV